MAAARCTCGSAASSALDVALAPGLITRIGVESFRELAPGERVELEPGGSIALDGEREIELGDGERAAVRLGDGPLRIDVDAVMAHRRNPDATCGALASLAPDKEEAMSIAAPPAAGEQTPGCSTPTA